MTPAESQQLAWLNSPEFPDTRVAPAEHTPWTAQQVGQALVNAWTLLFGAGPTARSVAVLLSQWALETGRGKSCYASNLGNARPPTTRGDTLCCQLTHVSEIIGGREYFFAPPSRGSTFRAFESLDEGAAWYLNSLHTRFAHAWPAVIAGDPTAYSLALAESHYYTANPAQYTRTMVALFNEFLSIALMGSSAAAPTEIPPGLTQIVQSSWLGEFHPDESAAENLRSPDPSTTESEPQA